MVREIKKPSVETYFVVKKGDIVHHGPVMPNQQANTGMGEFEVFTDKKLYEDRLNKLGVKLEEDFSERDA
jgi:hypothetical protein